LALGCALVVPSIAWFLYCIQYSSHSREGLPDWLAFSGLVYVVLAAAFFFFIAKRLNI
jgi:succinate dehydrogenase hydrophobic anchor subunit